MDNSAARDRSWSGRDAVSLFSSAGSGSLTWSSLTPGFYEPVHAPFREGFCLVEGTKYFPLGMHALSEHA